jgi:hypothetical protein
MHNVANRRSRRAATQLTRTLAQTRIGARPAFRSAPLAERYDGLPRLDLTYGLSAHVRSTETRKVREPRVPSEQYLMLESAHYQAMRDLVAFERAKRVS